MRLSTVAAVLAAVLATVAEVGANWWSPVSWTDASTIEIRTTDAGQAPHWFPVWLVVLDGQVYVRLGNRAAGRFERSTTKPYVDVRVAGQEFLHVHGVPAPEQAERVAAAMAGKYWFDLAARQFAHPLTLRLTLE